MAVLRRNLAVLAAGLLMGGWWTSGPHSRPPRADFPAVAAPTLAASSATRSAREGSGRHKWFKVGCSVPTVYLKRFQRGFWSGRSPDIIYFPKQPNFFAGYAHSGPWPHVQRVPLLLYGPGFIEQRGSVSLGRGVTLADVAPTFAELLGTELPAGRPGRSLSQVLVPAGQRSADLRLIVTVVWDGGGTNALQRWKGAWPYLARLMKKGASVRDVTVGSAPSSTPPIHATLATGTYPNDHGITDIPMRVKGKVQDSYAGSNPKFLELETLADIYDRETSNAARVGMFAEKAWHLGMIGHGSQSSGGDRDFAAIAKLDSYGGLTSNTDFYRLPAYLQNRKLFRKLLRKLDARDGAIDDSWLGHEILDSPKDFAWTPVWQMYQTDIVKQLLRRENFGRDDVADLFYVNYKQIDHVGHRWTFISNEGRAAIRQADRELKEIVEFLNNRVGRRRWVLALTSDHGMQPGGDRNGGWKIQQPEITADLKRRFGSDIIVSDRSTGLWLNRRAMKRRDVTRSQIANYLVNYTIKDQANNNVPKGYQPDRRLFQAAFPSDALPRLIRCSRN